MNKNIDPWWVVAVTTNKLVEITIMTRSIRKGGERRRGKRKGERGKGKGDCLDWTQNTRYTDWVIKWVIVRIAVYFCASLSQILIPEIVVLTCPHMLKSASRGQRNSKGNRDLVNSSPTNKMLQFNLLYQVLSPTREQRNLMLSLNFPWQKCRRNVSKLRS